MGAPTSDRPRRGGIKCEFCGRVVLSAAALESHQASLHSQALKEKVRRNSTSTTQPPKILKKVTPKIVPKDAKLVGKTSVEPKSPNVVKLTKPVNIKPKMESTVEKIVAQASKVKQDAKSVKQEAKNIINKTINKTETKSSTPRKVEYKCPKCDKTFPVQFFAQKHIQKHHCVDSKDEKVTPDSPDIIQPILVEYCKFCDDKFPNPHDCPNRSQLGAGVTYDCVGCQQQFKANAQFDIHIPDVHGDGAESMFFLLEKEFTSWKEDMEAQTDCSYMLMSKYKNKEVYRCSELVDFDDDSHAQVCPSTFFKTKFSKGIQVHFFPKHYKHEFKKYVVKEQYKPYSVTDLINQGINNSNLSCDEDLYLQFKSLMESIIFEAAKLNIDTLKTLINKAMEMDTILNEYCEDVETEEISDRSIVALETSKNDDKIVKTLPKLEVKNLNIVTLDTRKKDDNIVKPLAVPESKKRVIEENVTNAKKRKTAVDNKTNKKSFSLADEKDSEKILKELDSGNVKVIKEQIIGQSPSSFNDSYKEFIDKAIKTQKQVKKRNVVKTKMGQFKPSLSPKKEVKRISAGIAKDIVYEVREQENDCNILVLKI